MLGHGLLLWATTLVCLVFMLTLHESSCAEDFNVQPRCTGIDENTTRQVVTFDGKNCTSVFGYASCNYNCGDTGVRLPFNLTGRSRRPLRLVVKAARSLQLEPACLSWVEVQSSARVVTVSNKPYSHKCQYWLRVIDSQVNGLDVGINDLTIVNSDVGFINLPKLAELTIYNSSITSIDHIGLDKYPGVIECSYVKNVFFMNITADKLTISDSAFETIGPGSILFNGNTLNITNVFIRNLQSKGITMLSGELNIVNSVIEYAAQNAIGTDDTKVTMTNVSIHKMDPPGFSFELENDVNLFNVKVAGKPLLLNSRFVTLKAQKIQPGRVETEDDIYITGFSDSYCNRQDGVLQCNYAGVEKTVMFEQNALPPQYPTSITASNDLDAEGDFSCSSIILLSVQGRYVSTGTPTCLWTGELVATNSSLVTVSGLSMKTLEVNTSTVNKMQSISSQRLTLFDSVIHDVYSVIVFDQAEWKRSKIKKITSLELQVLKMDDCYIDQILKINLGQGTNGTSVISNTVVNQLTLRGSIQILSGNLELNNVTIVSAPSGSILVGPSASLLLRNVTFVEEIYGIVEAPSRNQVRIESSFGVTKTSSTLVNVHSTSVGDADTIPHDALNAGSGSSYCEEVSLQTVRCDYSPLQQSDVLVSNSFPVVVVSGASSVWIEPRDSQIVFLTGVSEVQVVPSTTNPKAQFFLECTNTSIVSLTSSIKALSLSSSSVSELFLIPGRPLIYLLVTSHSEINSIAVEAERCDIEQGMIGNVHYLRTRRLTLQDTSIVNLNSNSVSNTEEIHIVDSHIDYIEKHGITSLGAINLRNVSISFAENCSIVVQKFGTLSMQNVIINQGDVSNFFCIIGSVSFVSNVTLGGITFETLSDFIAYFGHKIDKDANESTYSSWDDLFRKESDGGFLEYSTTNNKSRSVFTPIFWVGISIGSLASMVIVVTGVLIFQTIQNRRRLSLASGHAAWRGSSDTVTCGNSDVMEPLCQNSSPHDVTEMTEEETNLDVANEKTRLVGN